jgi:hypothetical protein
MGVTEGQLSQIAVFIFIGIAGTHYLITPFSSLLGLGFLPDWFNLQVGIVGFVVLK